MTDMQRVDRLEHTLVAIKHDIHEIVERMQAAFPNDYDIAQTVDHFISDARSRGNETA